MPIDHTLFHAPISQKRKESQLIQWVRTCDHVVVKYEAEEFKLHIFFKESNFESQTNYVWCIDKEKLISLIKTDSKLRHHFVNNAERSIDGLKNITALSSLIPTGVERTLIEDSYYLQAAYADLNIKHTLRYQSILTAVKNGEASKLETIFTQNKRNRQLIYQEGIDLVFTAIDHGHLNILQTLHHLGINLNQAKTMSIHMLTAIYEKNAEAITKINILFNEQSIYRHKESIAVLARDIAFIQDQHLIVNWLDAYIHPGLASVSLLGQKRPLQSESGNTEINRPRI